MLVAHEVADRYELVVEATLRRGRSPALMRRKREGVLILTRNAVLLGHVLAGLAHRLRRELLGQLGVREPPTERRVEHGTIASRETLVRLGRDERRARHRLGTARDEEL